MPSLQAGEEQGGGWGGGWGGHWQRRPLIVFSRKQLTALALGEPALLHDATQRNNLRVTPSALMPGAAGWIHYMA